ncbi:NADH-quinone oxidoreductase subunit C [Streptomyces sp. NPDC059783]|uniref:NADH-quinone oxidoreductase subunit C n=1 Tax=Streptomyces sp. NPDC059783 TaxID=3346944 RepID=UPI00364F2947
MTTPAAPAEVYGRLPDAAGEIFGEGATAERAYELLTVDVPPASWTAALETARDTLGCTYFDWLSAVDEPGTGFRVCAHVAALPGEGTGVRRLLLRTTVPHEAAVLPTATGVYAGAAWHERETHEMFGIGFEGHPHLVPLLLPEGFEGHPLRKDFVLAARVAKAWPGAKEPGESEHGGPKRRTMLPPGVPDPNEWGPLKGQLPPAPARPARAARPAPGERPPRRTRTTADATPAAPDTAPTETPTPRPRRNRSASQGSASQQPAPGDTTPGAATGAEAPTGTPPEAGKPTDAVPGDSASADAVAEATKPTDAIPRDSAPTDAVPGSGKPADAARRTARPVSPGSDAPWHDARPAFDEPAGPSQPLRRLRSGGPGAEPPVREGAGRGEAQRSDTPDTPAAPPPEAAPSSESTPAPESAPDTDTPDADTPPTPRTPDSGGDPE